MSQVALVSLVLPYAAADSLALVWAVWAEVVFLLVLDLVAAVYQSPLDTDFFASVLYMHVALAQLFRPTNADKKAWG